MRTCNVLGVDYTAQPTTRRQEDACEGCVGDSDEPLCFSLDNCEKPERVIWIKQEQPS